MHVLILSAPKKRRSLSDFPIKEKHREKNISNLRGEYEKALERLGSFKEAYLTGLKVGLNSLRDESERGMEKRGAFRGELLTKMEKITSIKDEYRIALEKADLLKQELMEFFQRYSLQNRLETENT